jgi:hypothetical protein
MLPTYPISVTIRSVSLGGGLMQSPYRQHISKNVFLFFALTISVVAMLNSNELNGSPSKTPILRDLHGYVMYISDG